MRIINHQHIDLLNYRKKVLQQHHKSNGTLENTDRSYLAINLDKIQENANKVDIKATRGSNTGREQRDRMHGSTLVRNRTISQAPRLPFSNSTTMHRGIGGTVSLVVSPNGNQKPTFASIERLKAFQTKADKASKYSRQPYQQNECKYELASTGETLQSNMKRVYGLQPASKVEEDHKDA